LILVVFGGMGSLSGTIIATFIIGLVNIILQPYAEIRMILYALILIIVMIFRPQGLLGSQELSTKLLPNFKWNRKEKSS
jgi:branched-chain amino acid transport system permease protein